MRQWNVKLSFEKKSPTGATKDTSRRSFLHLQTKKSWASGSHKDPNNRLLTDHGSKFGILLDQDGEGKARLERKTSAGTVVFENGMAVVPNDMRGKDIAAELKSKARYPEQINYHPDRDAFQMKRDRQVMWRMPAWNWKCKVEGCPNEAVVQRLCEDHWGNT
jgi:hypothetical protein